MSFLIVQGDLDPDMEIALTENDAVLPLAGTETVTLRWQKPDGSVTTAALAVIDGAGGLVARVWEDGDTDQPGVHSAQVVIERVTGELQTFPSDGSLVRWTVCPRLGG